MENFLVYREGMIMWNIDALMFEFISLNRFFLGIVYGVLKIIAKATPGVLDDKILTFLGQSLKLMKKEADERAPLPDKPDKI